MYFLLRRPQEDTNIYVHGSKTKLIQLITDFKLRKDTDCRIYIAQDEDGTEQSRDLTGSFFTDSWKINRSWRRQRRSLRRKI